MTFTPENITALIGGLVVLVGAISLAARQIIGALTEFRAEMKAEAAKTVATVEAKVLPLIEKVDENLAETKVVKGHVNSAATKSASEADALKKEMAQLREQLGEAKQIAALLQQSQSAQVAVAAARAVETVAQIVEAGVKELNGGHPPVEASLKKIEANTKDTAKNTARTDAAVEQLNDKR